MPDERGQLRGKIVIGTAAEGYAGKTGEFMSAQFLPVYQTAALREF
jgi:hypothetical protein